MSLISIVLFILAYFIYFMDITFYLFLLLILSNLVIHKLEQFMEAERSNIRQLSSIRDLTLEIQLSNKGKKVSIIQEGRRKTRKFQPIKRLKQTEQIFENFLPVSHSKTIKDSELIIKALEHHFIFTDLIKDKKIQAILLEKFSCCQIEKNQYLLKQNDDASSFFILSHGKLSVEINGEIKKFIKIGEGFGELALLYSAPRSASICAVQHSTLWYIDRKTFRKCVEAISQKKFEENRNHLQNYPLFNCLTADQKDKLASICISQKYKKGQYICKEGELASAMYILKSGEIQRALNAKQLGIYNPGQCIQKEVTVSKHPICNKQTLIAQSDCQILAMGRQDIISVLGRNISIVMIRNKAQNIISQCDQLAHLEGRYLQYFIDLFKIVKFKKNEKIISKGQSCINNIFFILQGQCQTQKSISKNNSLFGQQALFAKKDAKYDFDLKFKKDGKIAQLQIKQLEGKFGCSLQQAIQRCKQTKKIISEQQKQLNFMKEKTSVIKLQQLWYIKKLGQGQFGQVYLVADNACQNFYALKCISKFQTIRMKLQKHLKNERQVLECLSNPFSLKYYRSFKDSNNIYFLTQFINGIQLFEAIRIIGILSIQHCRFYGAIMLNMLQYFHKKGILYRDLKPENILVCEDGYLKLIDMGTCKMLKGNEPGHKTFTVLGTPNYMAPQILAGKGYTFTADLWSLGVILYQFVAGYVPFGEQQTDVYRIYQQILSNELTFPAHMTDKNYNSLISQLLNKNPETRLKGSYSQLKNHPFFQQFNWNALLKKEIEAPFKMPSNKIINTQKLVKGKKPLQKLLKPSSKQLPVRKDLDLNWDAEF